MQPALLVDPVAIVDDADAREAERRQDVGDVAREGPGEDDDEGLGPVDRRVGVGEIGDAIERHVVLPSRRCRGSRDSPPPGRVISSNCGNDQARDLGEPFVGPLRPPSSRPAEASALGPLLLVEAQRRRLAPREPRHLGRLAPPAARCRRIEAEVPLRRLHPLEHPIADPHHPPRPDLPLTLAPRDLLVEGLALANPSTRKSRGVSDRDRFGRGGCSGSARVCSSGYRRRRAISVSTPRQPSGWRREENAAPRLAGGEAVALRFDETDDGLRAPHGPDADGGPTARRQTSSRDHEPDRSEPVRLDHAARCRLPGDSRQRGIGQDDGRAPPRRLPRFRRSGDRRARDPGRRLFSSARALCRATYCPRSDLRASGS